MQSLVNIIPSPSWQVKIQGGGRREIKEEEGGKSRKGFWNCFNYVPRLLHWLTVMLKTPTQTPRTSISSLPPSAAAKVSRLLNGRRQRLSSKATNTPASQDIFTLCDGVVHIAYKTRHLCSIATLPLENPSPPSYNINAPHCDS